MAETLLQFQTLIESADGSAYRVKACGAPMPDGVWQGWLEFVPIDGGEPIRSQRETTQPNRADTEYWATGLTPVYLEGALRRAIAGPVHVPVTSVAPPRFDGPAASIAPVPAREPSAHGVLDPFSVYEKGEALLRRQLGALSAWHLVNIINEHELSDASADALNARPAAELIDIIVDGVVSETARSARRR